MIDLNQEVLESQDFEVLRAFVRTLKGLPCLKAEVSYAGELTIHFGYPVPCSSRFFAGKTKGSWTLGTRGSEWTISFMNPASTIASKGDELDIAQEVEARSSQLTGEAVLDVLSASYVVPKQSGFSESLLIRLTNGTHIYISPTADPEDTGLPDWELFTPFGMYLTCGPGEKWSYLRSNAPTKSIEALAEK